MEYRSLLELAHGHAIEHVWSLRALAVHDVVEVLLGDHPLPYRLYRNAQGE
jgi:hypothetical protein